MPPGTKITAIKNHQRRHSSQPRDARPVMPHPARNMTSDITTIPTAAIK